MAEVFNNSFFNSITNKSNTVFENCIQMPVAIIFYMTVQSINVLLGIPANVMVLWSLHNNKKDSCTSDIFTLQLAVLDTIFCLFVPLELVSFMIQMPGFVQYLLGLFYGLKDLSFLFLCCICTDRYVAVVHPITFTALKDHHHRTVCVVSIWLIILVYAACKCIGTIPKFQNVFTVVSWATFVFMVFCNISILMTLRKSGPSQEEMHPTKKKAFRMVLIILAITIFHYFLPVAILPFCYYASTEVMQCVLDVVIYAFINFSSSTQPMLHLSNSKIPFVSTWTCKGC